MTEEPTGDSPLHRTVGRAEPERGNQIADDVVVVPRVEGDIVPSRVGQGTDDVERLIAVERCDFDRNHVRYLDESPPERVPEGPPSDARLQVEADDCNLLGNAFAMSDQFGIGRIT